MIMILSCNNKVVKLPEVDFYKLQRVCEDMVNNAIENESLREIYENYFRGKITKFSAEMEFCLHELGLAIHDPLNIGRDEVMFSNGHRTYIAPTELIKKEGFDRTSINDDKVGFPMLTDEVIGLDRNIDSLTDIDNGFIDDDSYMKTDVFGNKESFARVYLMHKMIKDKELFKEYKEHIGEYKSVMDFLINKLGYASVNKNDQGEIEIEVVQGINSDTSDIIDRLSGNSIEQSIIGRG